jgi:kynurenine formamidase
MFMKTTTSILLSACVLLASGVFASRASTNARVAQGRPTLTKADIDRMMTELSNWGRWGKDDQLGALNLITPAKRKQAAALVKEGVSVSLARDVEKERAADTTSPFQHTMTLTPQFSLDAYSVSYHGYAHTHLDALCHMFYQGKMYNGFSQEEVTQKGGARLSIHNVKQGVFTRGILMDIARLKGVPYLEPETAIYPEDLEAWEKKAGIKVTSGDVIFIRTGRWARRAAVGPWDVSRHSAGLHASCARWLKQRGVAILGSDAASDVVPSRVEGVTLPIHQLVLIALGVHIFDNCDLEAIGEAAARRNRWEFLLTAAPLAVPGGTGSPLNPIATF